MKQDTFLLCVGILFVGVFITLVITAYHGPFFWENLWWKVTYTEPTIIDRNQP